MATRILADGGDFSITERVENDSIAWDLNNGIVQAVYDASAASSLKLAAFGRVDRSPWAGLDQPCFGVTMEGATMPPRPGAASATVDHTGDSIELRISFDHGSGHDVTVHVRMYSGLAVIEQWLTVETDREATIASYVPFRIGLELPEPALATVAGVQRQGGWRPTEGVYRSFRLEKRPVNGGNLDRVRPALDLGRDAMGGPDQG